MQLLLFASLSTEALRKLKRTWDSASLRAKTLIREIKENMGQSESKKRDFKEQKRSRVLKTLEVGLKEKRS
jgi:hypothetical protein